MAKDYIVLPKETAVELRYVNYVEKLGYDCIKICKRGWPDRLIMLTNGYSFFIEFKREGEVPSRLQLHTHQQLRDKGHHVYVCSNFEHAKEITEYEIAWHEIENGEFVDYYTYGKMI